MFVGRKLQPHLIQWLRLNFISARLSPTAMHCFRLPRDVNFASARHLYRNEPLGKNSISKMMERISIKAELSTITSLFQCGVDARKICAITKHKDKRSLSHYISETTSEQKRECSKILSDTFQPQIAVRQEASGIPKQNVSDPSASPSSNLTPQSLLQNQFISLAQPYQNCTQHIQIGTMNIYHGKCEQPSPSTRKRRRIIESDDSD